MTEQTDRERPSRHGQALGDALWLLMEAGKKDFPGTPPECCATCAFRRGCMTNQMAATGIVALNCVLGVDRDRFACHHNLKPGGEPAKLCSGYIMATLAPWSFTKEVLEALNAELGKRDGEPDPVRAAFDAWVEANEPMKTADDYDRAREWNKNLSRHKGYHPPSAQ